MKQPAPPAQILAVFAQYGLNKTSMADLARAAGLSRQSLYNRFGSKNAVLEWAIRGVVENSMQQAIAALEDNPSETVDTILDAYHAWTGQHVSVVKHTPHGAELLAHATDSVGHLSANYLQEFTEALQRFLLTRGIASTESEAGELAFVLNMASNGLLHKVGTEEQYIDGVRRTLGALLKDRSG